MIVGPEVKDSWNNLQLSYSIMSKTCCSQPENAFGAINSFRLYLIHGIVFKLNQLLLNWCSFTKLCKKCGIVVCDRLLDHWNSLHISYNNMSKTCLSKPVNAFGAIISFHLYLIYCTVVKINQINTNGFF